MIDSCRLVNQSNYLNSSNKDCDWLILACFIRKQSTTDATFPPLGKKKKFWFEKSANAGEKFGIFIIKQKKALRKRQNTEEVEKNTRLRLVFSPTLLISSNIFNIKDIDNDDDDDDDYFYYHYF